MKKLFSRRITCPGCGRVVTLPWLWVLGVEMVARCQGCKRTFKTGYKMGALLFALSLTLSLAVVNICVWIFSSYSLPFFVLLIVPLWIGFGFVLRKWRLLSKCRRNT